MPNRTLASAIIAGAALVAASGPAFAWDEEGHKIVALIADHYLEPAVKQKVDAILASDTDSRIKHDIASEATWSGLPPVSVGGKTVPPVAKSWHSVEIELDHPDIDAACVGHPPLPAGTPASQGPADCALDKIDQFAAELSSPRTSASERLLALKYLLALVGDLHQPLYASDNHNQGGEGTRVSGGGGDPGTLRHYWDAEFIDYLGDDPKAIADDLADGIRQSKTFDKMSSGTPRDWATEAFALAKDHAYGKLPAKKPDGSYDLPPDYITDGIETVRLQLAHAGVRLAAILNRALSKS